MQDSPAAIGALRNMALKIAGLCEHGETAASYYSLHARIGGLDAFKRFFGELTLSYSEQAHACRAHAAQLTEACLLIPPADRMDLFTAPVTFTHASDPEEALTATYTHLNLLAANYTRLHTLAIAFEHAGTAELALHHLKAVTPKIVECSQVLPLLTAEMAYQRFGFICEGAAQLALAATQAAWKSDLPPPRSLEEQGHQRVA